MKWEKQDGSVQRSSDGRYVCVQANSQHVIAYALTPYGTGQDLGACPSMEVGRQRCEDHERQIFRKRA